MIKTNKDEMKENNINDEKKSIVKELKDDLYSPERKRETLIKGIILSEILKSPRDKY